MEAVLSESNEETGAYDPLDRLKMAMNYEEKKVSIDSVFYKGLLVCTHLPREPPAAYCL